MDIYVCFCMETVLNRCVCFPLALFDWGPQVRPIHPFQRGIDPDGFC